MSPAGIEEALAALLYGGAVDPGLAAMGLHYDAASTAAVRKMVLERKHRGTGGVRDWYPRTLAAWWVTNPGDTSLDLLAERFCGSTACRAWREHATNEVGISLEEALYRFFEAEGVGDATVREDELLGTVVRALAVAPRAAFSWPVAVRVAPRGCFAVTRALQLHAALDGSYVCGPVTPLIAELLSGASIAGTEVATLRGALEQRGLL
jgi:hypothetical protein